MQVQLLVERDQNECIVNLAGTAYKFKRNEYGHLVSDITDQEHIKWVSDPNHNTAFKAYSVPKKKIIEEELPLQDLDDEIAEVGKNAYAPHYGQVDETPTPDLPPYPKKGSKRPPRSKG